MVRALRPDLREFVLGNRSSYIVVATRRQLLCLGAPTVVDWLTQLAAIDPLWSTCIEVSDPAKVVRELAEIYLEEIARATGRRWRLEPLGSEATGFDLDAVPEDGGKRVALSLREEISDEDGHDILTVFRPLDAVIEDAKTPYYTA